MTATTSSSTAPAVWLTRAGHAGRDPILLAAAAILLIVVIGEMVSPGFASTGQLVNMLRVASFLGVLAVGQTLVILSGGGGIDLSVGKVATLGAIIGSRIMQGDDARLVPGVLAALACCAAIGLLNGVGVAYLSIPPFVMTLGMAGVVHGVIMVYTGGRADGRAAPGLSSLVNDRFLLDLPGAVVLWVLLAVVVTVVLRRTTFGWRLFAVGSNPVTAELSAVPVRRTLVLTYTVASVCAALGGLLLVGYTESVMINLADDYTMPSIAAVIIGGTIAAGGIGGYVGTALGAVMLTVLTSLLTTLNLGSAWRVIIAGAVLLVLLTVYGRQQRLRA